VAVIRTRGMARRTWRVGVHGAMGVVVVAVVAAIAAAHAAGRGGYGDAGVRSESVVEGAEPQTARSVSTEREQVSAPSSPAGGAWSAQSIAGLDLPVNTSDRSVTWVDESARVLYILPIEVTAVGPYGERVGCNYSFRAEGLLMGVSVDNGSVVVRRALTGFPPDVLIIREATVWVPSRRWLVAYSGFAPQPCVSVDLPTVTVQCEGSVNATYVLKVDDGTWAVFSEGATGPDSPSQWARFVADTSFRVYMLGLRLWYDAAVDAVYASGGFTDYQVPLPAVQLTFMLDLDTLRWHNLPTMNSPCAEPTQPCYTLRAWGGFGWDAGRRHAWFFSGGSWGQFFFTGDCWVLDVPAATWFHVASCAYTAGPSIRTLTAVTHVPELDAYVMVGGQASDSFDVPCCTVSDCTPNQGWESL